MKRILETKDKEINDLNQKKDDGREYLMIRFYFLLLHLHTEMKDTKDKIQELERSLSLALGIIVDSN